MALQDYVVTRDHFKDSDDCDYCFPCCCCVHRHQEDYREPCRTCDHNTMAEDD